MNKRRIGYGLWLGLILVGLIGGGFWLRQAGRAFAFSPLAGTPPTEGWVVCEDRGFGPVAGVSGSVQQMVMCNGDGWRLLMYCIEPGKPAPPLNQVCSLVSATEMWCGDTVQMFRQLALLATPAPSSTPTATLTPTPTATFTVTPSPSATPTAAATQTPVRTSTIQVGQTITAVKGESLTATPQATPFVRPHAGGPGNLGLVLSGAVALAGAALSVLALFLRLKSRSAARQDP